MKFLIIGGDTRTVRLIEQLHKDNDNIYIYGLENAKDLQKNTYLYKELNIDDIKNIEVDAVIGPIPFTKDGEKLNAPFSSKDIYINDLLPNLKGKKLIAGPISQYLDKIFEQEYIQVIDIMKQEELIIYNTIATAEGTIKIAIENMETNLAESKILILGFGKVAKTLAFKLKNLAGSITCSARKMEDIAWIQTLGYDSLNINNLGTNLQNYDIIINTVPHIILTEEILSNISKDTLIIDLASKPGGVDKKAVEKLELKYIWALAIPGKVAPLSSAKYIKQAIYNIGIK